MFFVFSTQHHLIGLVHQGNIIGPEGSTFDLLQGESHRSLRGQLGQEGQARPAVAAKRSSWQKGLQHLGENMENHQNAQKRPDWDQLEPDWVEVSLPAFL